MDLTLVRLVYLQLCMLCTSQGPGYCYAELFLSGGGGWVGVGWMSATLFQ